MFQWGAPWGWGSLLDPNFLYFLFMLLCESQKIIDIHTITATEVQYLSQFMNILLITLYLYLQFFGTCYHRSQIGASNFTCIYCADIVVLDQSRIEKCQSHSNATDCHNVITLLFQSLQGQQDRMRLCWSSCVKRSLKLIMHLSQSAHPAQGFHSEYLHWYLNNFIMWPDFFCIKILPWKTFQGWS